MTLGSVLGKKANREPVSSSLLVVPLISMDEHRSPFDRNSRYREHLERAELSLCFLTILVSSMHLTRQI